jgi:hypothetical protein
MCLQFMIAFRYEARNGIDFEHIVRISQGALCSPMRSWRTR